MLGQLARITVAGKRTVISPTQPPRTEPLEVIVSLAPKFGRAVTYVDMIEALEVVDLLVERLLISFFHCKRPDVRQSVQQFVEPCESGRQGY